MTTITNTILKISPNVAMLVLTLLVLNLAASAFAQPINEKLTTSAFMAYETNNYEAAITNAQECIDQFDIRAEAIQAQLLRDNATVTEGRPANETVRLEISSRGPLNDVATCYFIMGEANRQMAKTDKTKIEAARKAYEAARKFTYARTWDTNGFFWSPATAASDRLRKLPPDSGKVR